MQYTTQELYDLERLERNSVGFVVLGSIIAACLMTDTVIIFMLLMRRQLLDPYMGPSLLINLAILATCAVSLSNRRLFYAPLVLSVVTGVGMIFTLMTFYLFAGDSDLIFFAALANVLLMLCLWTAYATTIKAKPARWLHPFQLPTQVDIEGLKQQRG